jgi:hypothetical protein
LFSNTWIPFSWSGVSAAEVPESYIGAWHDEFREQYARMRGRALILILQKKPLLACDGIQAGPSLVMSTAALDIRAAVLD